MRSLNPKPFEPELLTRKEDVHVAGVRSIPKALLGLGLNVFERMGPLDTNLGDTWNIKGVPTWRLLQRPFQRRDYGGSLFYGHLRAGSMNNYRKSYNLNS